MQYSYYPGCSMDTTGITYKKSIEYVCGKINLVLHEIPDWNCCGATCAHSKNEKVALSLPARNLALAEEEGLGLDVAVPCASCYSRMKHTVHAARKDEAVRQELEEISELAATLPECEVKRQIIGRLALLAEKTMKGRLRIWHLNPSLINCPRLSKNSAEKAA